ncbi:hypothetical protein DB32_000892 [Sandaracinus amylolyticus]|uniref:Uncharacterized protein n=1 Tax=Sandaracinus amylolyticus TaxID=927083 RepID=A0A0F6VZN9_9BACT|nr:hypothetical protein DB32_000892 [Sandaracinus amylolyticus]
MIDVGQALRLGLAEDRIWLGAERHVRWGNTERLRRAARGGGAGRTERLRRAARGGGSGGLVLAAALQWR